MRSAFSSSDAAIIRGFAAARPFFKSRRQHPITCRTSFSELRHGTRLSSHGQAPDGGKQRLPRQQQDQASFPAQSAPPPLLDREREPLGAAARQQRGAAPDRQGGHRSGHGRSARARRSLKEPAPWPRAHAKRSSWSPPLAPGTSTPPTRTRRPRRTSWSSSSS